MATFPSPRELFSIFIENLVGLLEITLMTGWGSPSDWPPHRISNSQTPASHSVGFSTLLLFPWRSLLPGDSLYVPLCHLNFTGGSWSYDLSSMG